MTLLTKIYNFHNSAGLIEGYCAAALAAMYAAWIDTFALTQIAITISYVFMLAFAGLLGIFFRKLAHYFYNE